MLQRVSPFQNINNINIPSYSSNQNQGRVFAIRPSTPVGRGDLNRQDFLLPTQQPHLLNVPRRRLSPELENLAGTQNGFGSGRNNSEESKESRQAQKSLERDLKLVEKIIREEQAIILRKIKDEHTSIKHTCSICMEGYQLIERVPVVLGCGHTICISCAKKMLKAAFIQCPFDNIKRKIEGGVERLPKNFSLIHLIEEEKQENKQNQELLGKIEEKKKVITKQNEISKQEIHTTQQKQPESPALLEEQLRKVTEDFRKFVQLSKQMKEGYDEQIERQASILTQVPISKNFAIKQSEYQWEIARFNFKKAVHNAEFAALMIMHDEPKSK
ncbi:hypothetical protein FGO68_gene672 [Halteria grandinella]|uniref:RING-type domain-containing protein n=1 Tax=Halteria grandinella TaxID=5974 RepID=A0A8J8T0B8_HALGN|nr:hypothetical protein FGO68_gene672 [Halteria grandinella]